jgi:hypothetical protein
MGLDGEMLVLRQAASRRCGRAIVDADAGCKMLSPGGRRGRCTRPPGVLRCTAEETTAVTDEGGKGVRDLLR